MVEDNRSASALPELSKINRSPESTRFSRNQDNLLISNDDFLGKVYVVEFSLPAVPPFVYYEPKHEAH